MDRRIFQLDHDGRRPNKGKLAVRVARLLRKFRAQPDCRRVRIRTVARPWLELATLPLTLVEHPAFPLLDEGPLEVWSVAQDLWRRLGVICPVTVSILDDSIELVFANARALDWDQDSMELIDRALNQHSYRWRHQGRQGDLAQFVEMRGNDLVVMATSFQQMVCWPEGQEVVSLIKSYLMHVQSGVTAASESTADTSLKFFTNLREGQPS